MELLVIVLCLSSERFLMHNSGQNRFDWFMSYGNGMVSRLSKFSSWSLLALIVLPLLLITWTILNTVGHLLFGTVGILFNLVIFYYCLGPVNPFYPVHAKPIDQLEESDIGNYLVQANGELFAILFWYLLLGPVGILAYRLLSLSQGLTAIAPQASELLGLLDWLPVRMTALLYLLVGNFQAGYRYFSKLFFSAPNKNNTLLSVAGLAALDNREQKTMLQAESLVEHATIVFLVLLAFCTIVAWV